MNRIIISKEKKNCIKISLMDRFSIEILLFIYCRKDFQFSMHYNVFIMASKLDITFFESIFNRMLTISGWLNWVAILRGVRPSDNLGELGFSILEAKNLKISVFPFSAVMWSGVQPSGSTVLKSAQNRWKSRLGKFQFIALYSLIFTILWH